MFRNPVTDLIIVAVVALLILGPKRLPMLGRSLGQGLREFKEGITGESKSDEADERPALTAATAADSPAAPTPVAGAPTVAATPAAAQAVRAGTDSTEAGASERSS
jgi:TatA/E family protein of Tat protein translocase